MSVNSSPPVSQALDVCANELLLMAGECRRLQDSLSPAFARQALFAEGQSLDMVTQTLGELGRYLKTLGAAAPDRWRLDTNSAAAAVRLSDLAERLRGASQCKPVSAGDFEFFGDEL